MSAKKTKSAKKPVAVKVIKRTRKPNALHDKPEKLFTRPGGCHDTYNAGFEYETRSRLRAR